MRISLALVVMLSSLLYCSALINIPSARMEDLAHLVASPNWPQFVNFAMKFNKSYQSIDEVTKRFNSFEANLQRIEELRAEYKEETGESGDHVFGVTKFADLSRQEFNQYKGFTPRAHGRVNVSVSVPKVGMGAPPTKWDWRDKNMVTPVKDQGQCGSCWAFSATEEIESSWAMQGNTLEAFSVQQIVSCDTVDAGCDGGDTITAYQYVEQAPGLELDSDYPYSSGDGDTGTCDFDSGSTQVTVSAFSYATKPCTDTCNKQDETTLVANLYSHGPVSICVDATDGWQLYTGGVFRSSCAHGYSDLNHCVQLVGYDQTGSVPYYIVRNSWADSWGIDGYMYVEMGKNLCGIADEATLVTTTAA